MKYQDFIRSNIDIVCDFKKEYGRCRVLFDAYANFSREKERIYHFLDKRVKYNIYVALSKKIEPFGYLAYIVASGVSTSSKFCFNYCIEFKIFDKYSNNHFYLSVVFTKNNIYISDNTKHNYRFVWNYDTEFGDIFYDWVEIYDPNEGIYMH